MFNTFAIDFFTVPTARFRVLYVLVIIWHETRKVVHFNVTEHPTARWTAQQIVEACPFDTLPRYLLRDRDNIYGEYFQSRIKNMGINEGHLKRILTEYLEYYHQDRTHLGLGKETPAGRSVMKKSENSKLIGFPRLGGLHHRYEWRNAA